MSFTDLNIEFMYRSNSDNLPKDFYIPLLKEAKVYKRAVGFFSSTALIAMSVGITELVKNGGKIRLIASPRLSREDLEAISKGYEEREKVISRVIQNSITNHDNYFELERLNLLAHLIVKGVLEIKIAFMEENNTNGLYHEKIGIIEDFCGNKVAFNGSSNESTNAFYHNFESITVFKSWKHLSETNIFENIFDMLWENETLKLNVIDFPKIAIEKLLKYKRDDVNLEIDCEEFPRTINENLPKIPSDVSLYNYQIQAINEWERNDFVGIFDMATGTGKTLTGLGAVVRLSNYLKNRIAVFIVCPYQHLVEQWVEDIISFNIRPIIGYSSSPQKDWKNKLEDNILDYNLGITNFFCFISTNATFASDFIQGQISKIKGDILLLVDEAHNFGAARLQRCLLNYIKYRLALSATLDRHMDEEGTQKLYDYFRNKCIEYDLERAIKEKKLTPYKYYPIEVHLSDLELEKYIEVSKEISKNCTSGKDGKSKLNTYGKMLAIKRARIVAGAVSKISSLCEKIEEYKDDSHLLVYCGATNILDKDLEELPPDDEDLRQINIVTKALGKKLKMRVAQFTSKENMQQREVIKQEFMKGEMLQALIAIRCLDEGVNIPKIKVAFILASSTNPKEYIQRRGRVLRKAAGKEYAIIYDFVTLPRDLDIVKSYTKEEIISDVSLVKNEIARIEEFSKLAMNPMDSHILVSRIREAYDLDDFKPENYCYEVDF